MSQPHTRVLVLVRPYLLGSALAHALERAEREVLVVDVDGGAVPPGRYSVIITTGPLPHGVEAEAVIELPPANSRSFGAIHHGNTTRLLAFDDPTTVSDALAQLATTV